jgi:hypothetical protein
VDSRHTTERRLCAAPSASATASREVGAVVEAGLGAHDGDAGAAPGVGAQKHRRRLACGERVGRRWMYSSTICGVTPGIAGGTSRVASDAFTPVWRIDGDHRRDATVDIGTHSRHKLVFNGREGEFAGRWGARSPMVAFLRAVGALERIGVRQSGMASSFATSPPGTPTDGKPAQQHRRRYSRRF